MMDFLMVKKIYRTIFLVTIITFLGCSKDDEGVGPEKPGTEEEVPIAVDDNFTTAENTILKVSGLLDNDTTFDYARITDVDSESAEGGSIVDNRDGTYTYTPPQDYTGSDSFNYQICDNATTPNCSGASVKITITAATPVAVDDNYETLEENELIIRNFLDNDQLLDNAAVVSVNSENSNATVVLEENGTITYSPSQGFAGEDTFTYTICDDDETPSCSTATITVTVVDEGSPVANNDLAVVQAGVTSATITNLLENDVLTDEAVLTSVDGSSSTGSVILNGDGTVTYKPATGFTGDDSFSYSLCDDDAPNNTCVTATVTVRVVDPVSFNIPSNLEGYYSNVVFTQDPDLLYLELSELTNEKHVNLLEYYMRHDYLYDADADLQNPEMVVLMYTGELRPWQEYQEGDLSEGETFNTEHIYPQSLLSSEIAKNDMHHMRVADVDINSERLNYPFTSGSGDAKLIGGNKWYPGDDWRGDVARMVMYINLKYGEDFTSVGGLDLFLKWNIEDPVSAFELQRQEIIEGAQGNRNPFIDNPYFATLLWGGTPAENTWD
jgi:endonuclease I